MYMYINSMYMYIYYYYLSLLYIIILLYEYIGLRLPGRPGESTANAYTYTPIVWNAVYITVVRHCKHLLVVVYKFMSCRETYNSYVD